VTSLQIKSSVHATIERTKQETDVVFLENRISKTSPERRIGEFSPEH